MKKSDKIEKILKKNENYTVLDGRYYFINRDQMPLRTAGRGLLGWMQNQFKKNGRLYNWLLKTVGPVKISCAFKKRLKKCLVEYDEKSTIINLGSGPQIYSNRFDIINIDISAFETVDILASACKLPFEDETVDFVVSVAMLEHVGDPKAGVNEIFRILKPGGEVLVYVPFLQPYHAAPHDYQRWNQNGLKKLFEDFAETDVFVGSGPSSAMVYITVEYLSIIFSIGKAVLHDLLFILFLILLFPFKYFDVLFERNKLAINAASAFAISAKKTKQ